MPPSLWAVAVTARASAADAACCAAIIGLALLSQGGARRASRRGTGSRESSPARAASLRNCESWMNGGFAEQRLMALCQAEANGTGDGRLSEEFADLLEVVPDAAIPRVRAALDGGLIFDARGRHLDLRRLVFDLPPPARNRALSRLHEACCAPAPERQGFVVLSDVDDTVLPGRDLFRVSGSDRSWSLDGRLYPGVAQMHTVLRGSLGPDRDYPVLLTARPPPLVSKLPGKLHELTDEVRPRMAILPGVGGFRIAANTVRILCHSYSKLAKMKVLRVVQYAWLFPDFVGRFVFIGDDGQGDLAAAADMLRLRAPRLEPHQEPPASLDSGASLLGSGPLLAFAAIHAVRERSGDFVTPPARRAQRVQELRRMFPPEGPGEAPESRLRFFYFEDYADLARQLASAGWIEAAQAEVVLRAVGAAREDLAQVPQPSARRSRGFWKQTSGDGSRYRRRED